MNQTLPLVLVTSLLAGGVGAVATTALRSDTAPQSPTVSTDGNGEVLSAIRDLQDDFDAMDQRLAMVESQNELAPISGSSMRSSVDAPAISKDDLQEAVAGFLKSEAKGASPITAQLVEAVIEEREQREDLEREERRQTDREKRLEDKLGKMQSELSLDQNQMASLRTLYQDHTAKSTEMWTSMRDGTSEMTREEGMAAWRVLNEERKSTIEGLMTPSQFETYNENGYDDRGGFGRRGGNAGGARNAGGRNNGGGGRRGGV